MSNTLKRTGYVQMTPAVPYVPYRPAYSYYEPIYGYPTVSGWGWSNGGGSVGSGPVPPGIVVVPPGSPQTIIGWKLVVVPEQPEQPGSPAQYASVPAAGWTSFAHSIASVPSTGWATFNVPVNVAGVVIGLSEYASPTSGYAHIKHGLRFSGDHVYNARTGDDYGTFATTDTFKTLNDGVNVVLSKNGTPLATEASTYRREDLYLSAVLYNIGDEVDNPELMYEAYGSSATSLSALTVNASQDTYGDAISAIPALTVSTGTGDYVAALVPPLAVLSADTSTYGAGIASIPALTATSYGGLAGGAGFAAADVAVPFFVTSALGLTGEIGGVDASMRPFAILASESDYGEAKTTLPPLYVFAYTEPNDEAYALETITASAPATAASVLLVTVLDGVAVGATAVATALLDAVVQEQLTASGTVATEQLLDAIARSFIQAGSTGILETTVGRTDLDTPVWHDQAGGSTMYRDYGFNSFARIGGKYYGANEDGLFLLEGGDDAGTPIHASIDLGRLDFKTAEKKTISQCYLGMAADGNLVLKVIAEGKEYLYKTRSFSPEMQQQRITTGKGLKTNYITAQFFNENGADFEIDSVRFFVADLTRRIN